MAILRYFCKNCYLLLCYPLILWDFLAKNAVLAWYFGILVDFVSISIQFIGNKSVQKSVVYIRLVLQYRPNEQFVSAMKNKAILIGASDDIERALVRELSTLYQTVILVTRTPPKSMTANMHLYHLADFDTLATALASIAIGADTDAFSCLEFARDEYMTADEFYRINVLHNIEFANLCKTKGVECFFYLSKQGAAYPDKSDELSAKADVEYHLQTLGFDNVVILRPNLVTSSASLLANVQNQAVGIAKQLLKPFKIPLNTRLSPEQVATCMAIAAYQANGTVQHKAMQIIEHEQMSRLINQKVLY